MEKSKQIKTKLAQVVDILTKLPETRDNDRELIATFWRIERPMLFAFNGAEAVLRALVNKELSSPDDITRARRKAQEMQPELRGTRWVQSRRRDNEADVRSNINKALTDAEQDYAENGASAGVNTYFNDPSRFNADKPYQQ